MSALPSVLLFDLDDTLVVFGSGKADVWREHGERFAPELGVGLEPLLRAVRSAADAYWSHPGTKDAGRLDMLGARRAIVAEALVQLGCERSEQGVAFADAFTWAREERVAPFPGAVETLEALRARGHRLGLVTNGSSEFQRRKIERYDLGRFFDDIRIEGEQGIGKPHPEVFEAALRALGAEPGEAWMIGDNLHADIAGAQALGITGVWVDAHRTGLPDAPAARPSRVIEVISELLEL
jgi:putative hydrolase of the HAD superfamily